MSKKRLKPKDKEFADKYLENNNATQSAKETFDIKDRNYAGVKGHRMIKKDNIRAYLEDTAVEAVSRIEVISKTAKNESVKLNANKDLADRGGLKPVEKQDINLTIVDWKKVLDKSD